MIERDVEAVAIEMFAESSSGFSLVEVLVSILVLALGVIGAVGMQLSALRSTQQSEMQTIATQLAADLVERMRANPNAMQADDASNPYLSVNFDARTESIPNERLSPCQHGKCAPHEFARADLRDWLMQLSDRLPAARARVCRDAAPWDDGIGEMRWDCRTDPAAPIVIKLSWHVKGGGVGDAPLLTLQTVF